MISWRTYQNGDIACIGGRDPDPFAGWLEYVEENVRGAVTVLLDGQPVAVSGCMSVWDGVADCFAVVDRDKAAGHGRLITRLLRARMLQAMAVLGIHRMQSTASVQDRAAQVFLRAIGLRQESIMRQGAPDRTDLIVFAILGAQDHDDQAKKEHQEN